MSEIGDAFYQERDQRTRELAKVADEVLRRPIGLRVGADAAATRAGQLAALATVNMLARVHRVLTIDAPATALQARALVNTSDLATALMATARAIDPFGQFELGPPPPGAMSIGIGADAPAGCSVYVGATGSCGVLDVRPVAVEADALLGAAMAACLAAGTVFRVVVLSHPVPAARKTISVWNVAEDEAAAPGPAALPPLDLGTVWMVGGGAVGCALAYWLREFGVVGAWIVIDADVVKLHNTNRGLLFLPAHAGWDGASVAKKARVVADALAARPVEDWLDAWSRTDPPRPDVVLPLANERGARHAVAALGLEVILHATTSRLGAGQLHRHVAGRDDCLTCRMHGTETATLACSTSLVKVGETSLDAALPFMSAGAGLLLVAALHRLQRGELLALPANQRGIDFLSPHRMTQHYERTCGPRCVSTLRPSLRTMLNAERRWAQVA